MLLFFEILNKNKDILNNINVFPIADGDTGRNLCTTLKCTKDIPFTNLEQYLKELSEETLMTARGSSGNILALYITGLSQNYSENLSEMCTKAAEFAWSTMFEPVEGTMLTAMKATPQQYSSTENFIQQYIQNVTNSLLIGPDILPVLKQNNTIDSGTLGFLYILCDIYRELTSEDITPIIEVTTPTEIVEVCSEQYCIEFNIVTKTSETFKTAMKNLGSEFICVSNKDLMKIHIHSNNYTSVLEKAKLFGTLQNLKVEDMKNSNKRIII